MSIFNLLSETETTPNEFVQNLKYVKNVDAYYKKEKVIAHGASSCVFKVHRVYDGLPFAMKQLPKQDELNQMLSKREIVNLHSLHHQSIIKIEDTFTDDENIYIVLELCCGNDLSVITSPLSEMKAIQIIKSMLKSLLYLHENHYVHRDLKPSNFVFRTEKHKEVVLIDLADTIKVNETQILSDVVGTVLYFSPETFRSRRGSELYASDVWAIGVITYQLVTGRAPFRGEKVRDIIRKILSTSFEFPPEIGLSQSCRNFITSLLQRNPNKRLTIQQALKHKWITSNQNLSLLRKSSSRRILSSETPFELVRKRSKS